MIEMLDTTKTLVEACTALPPDELLELLDGLADAEVLDTWDDEDGAPVYQVLGEEDEGDDEEDEEETTG